mmetsp:Transcript_79960/g.166264  ORF Transcript_79960/g.166264 Transcript_79960/m.166264 type:complete len:366 (-) Transcript_79960:364-1461(-)
MGAVQDTFCAATCKDPGQEDTYNGRRRNGEWTQRREGKGDNLLVYGRPSRQLLAGVIGRNGSPLASAAAAAAAGNTDRLNSKGSTANWQAIPYGTVEQRPPDEEIMQGFYNRQGSVDSKLASPIPSVEHQRSAESLNHSVHSHSQAPNGHGQGMVTPQHSPSGQFPSNEHEAAILQQRVQEEHLRQQQQQQQQWMVPQHRQLNEQLTAAMEADSIWIYKTSSNTLKGVFVIEERESRTPSNNRKPWGYYIEGTEALRPGTKKAVYDCYFCQQCCRTICMHIYSTGRRQCKKIEDSESPCKRCHDTGACHLPDDTSYFLLLREEGQPGFTAPVSNLLLAHSDRFYDHPRVQQAGFLGNLVPHAWAS